MAAEINVARESGVNPINAVRGISSRTANFYVSNPRNNEDYLRNINERELSLYSQLDNISGLSSSERRRREERIYEAAVRARGAVNDATERGEIRDYWTQTPNGIRQSYNQGRMTKAQADRALKRVRRRRR